MGVKRGQKLTWSGRSTHASPRSISYYLLPPYADPIRPVPSALAREAGSQAADLLHCIEVPVFHRICRPPHHYAEENGEGGRSPDDHKEPLLPFFSPLPLPLSVQVSISIFASLGKWTYRTRRHPNHAAAMKEADNKIFQ